MADRIAVDTDVTNNTRFPTVNNEEIIAEVIKNIEEVRFDSLSDVDTLGVVSDNDTKISGSGDDDDIPEDFDTVTEETDNIPYAHDLIDETAMEINESGLTEQEKESRREEADGHKMRGNDMFKSGEYRDSADCYTLALRTCPLVYQKQRSVMYCNRAAAKMKLSLTATAIEDCSKAIELDPTYLKAYFRRAQLYEIESDKLDEALTDYKKILELDPKHKEAIIACHKLPKEIEIRNEKMKTEMLGKLKDLGNMILRPFGLSTNNFQMNPDPSGSGGYSINFNQNAGQADH